MNDINIRYKATPTMVDGTQISIDTDKPKISIEIDGIILTVIKDQFDFLFETKITVSDEELEKLKDVTSIVGEEDIRVKVSDEMRNKVREILKRLTYYYGIMKIKETFTAIGNVEWSLDEVKWFQIITKYPSKWVPAAGIYYLPENLPSLYPQLLKEEPFLAFEFLHKAFNESNPKFSWISATVAAELAFKEFVSRFEPRFAYLITNLPSPPLNKLYNHTLNELVGVSSPFHSKLKDGYDFRNKIVHNPKTEFNPPFALDMYLQIVQSALLHLTHLLSKDTVSQYFYNSSVSKLNKDFKTSYPKIE